MSTTNLVQKSLQTFFVLVKPDGVDSVGKIRQMFLDAFLKGKEQANIEFFEEITPAIIKGVGKFTKDMILAHYAKPDPWLIKYGKKIISARTGVDIESISEELGLEEGKKIPDALADYMCSGSMWAFVFQSNAENTFDIARTVLGDVDPSKASPDSIRGKYSKDSFRLAWTDPLGARAIHNVCHCSDSQEEAEREIRLFLGDLEAGKYFQHLE